MSDYHNETLIKGFEGGSVSIANRGDKKLVIVNEAAALDLLDAADRDGLDAETIYEFDSESSRLAFLQERYDIHKI